MARTVVPVDQFDPNTLKDGFYGLYNGQRFFVSNNRASMIQKAYHAGGEWSFWSFENGKWVRVGYKHPISDGYPCDECGITLARVTHPHYRQPHTKLEGGWDWKRSGGKIEQRLRYMRFCDPCLTANRGY